MSADFSVQRANMVEGQLRTTDVSSAPLLEAMGELPREAFVPSRIKKLAYMDADLEVAAGSDTSPARYLMRPSAFAKLIQLADVQPSDVVLDIGCATGYSTAVLSRLASFVVALECDSSLAEEAEQHLAEQGCVNIAVVTGPLENGHQGDAPYDVILVGGAAETMPPALLAQLREGGRLVAVLGRGNAARAHLFIKDNGVVSQRTAFNAAIKPLPGFTREAVFSL